MNVAITKDRCRVRCRNARELYVVSFDEVHDRGCDLIVIDDKRVVYVIECKESLKSGSSANKILQQIDECVNFIKQNISKCRSIRKVYIKERGKRSYSSFIDVLKRHGVEIYEDAFEIVS